MKFNKNILLAAAAVLSFAACQTEPKEPTDAEVDALVTAKVDEVKMNLAQECDNSILALATAKADSTMVEMGNKPGQTIVINKTVTTPTSKTTTTTTKKTEEVKGNETIGKGKPKIGGDDNNKTIGSGKPKIGGSQNEDGDQSIGGGKPKIGDK